MWILKQPVLFHGRVAHKGFKIIEEPNLVAKDWVVEVEIVSRESMTVNKDDTSPITNLCGGYAVYVGASSRSLSYEEE